MPTLTVAAGSFSVLHDHPLIESAAVGVLSVDSTDTGNPLAVAAVNGKPAAVGNLITLPSGAELDLWADGSFSYKPLANSAYTDNFVYTATDQVNSAATFDAEKGTSYISKISNSRGYSATSRQERRRPSFFRGFCSAALEEHR